MFRPLNARVLVKRREEKEMTAGGIFIPPSSQETSTQGKVVAVGAGRMIKGEIRPLEVKPDDEIIFEKYAGTEVSIRGEDFVVLHEDNILGILK